MYDDSPDWRLLNALFRCLYADHPLRDDIAGTVESIAELTPQMLYNCTKAFYAPSNMVLSVAGKITLAQAVDACKRNGVYDRARAPHEVEWDIPRRSRLRCPTKKRSLQCRSRSPASAWPTARSRWPRVT